MTEDEIVGWRHRLNGHEFEQALEVGDGQAGLVCCSPCGCKELETTVLMDRAAWRAAIHGVVKSRTQLSD